MSQVDRFWVLLERRSTKSSLTTVVTIPFPTPGPKGAWKQALVEECEKLYPGWTALQSKWTGIEEVEDKETN
jgi:hypothetical protein